MALIKEYDGCIDFCIKIPHLLNNNNQFNYKSSIEISRHLNQYLNDNNDIKKYKFT